MKTLRCKDAGFDCEGVIKANSEEEILSQAAEHAHVAHHVHVAPELTEQLKALTRDDRQSDVFKFYIYWIPYLAYILLILGIALARIPTSLTSKVGFLAIFCLLVAALLLCGHVYLVFKASTKNKKQGAKLALFISTFFFVLLLLLTEFFLSPVKRQYSPIQKAIQNQLKRRNQNSSQEFRGVIVRNAYNELGWADQQRQYIGKKQIVFIGDSFLEVRSSKNLATITQELSALKGVELEVVNLSKDDTGVNEYRYRFHEFALDMKPEHIFIFVYEGNDISYDYTYKAYQSDMFRITDEALNLLQEDTTIPEHTKYILNELRQKKSMFTDKTDLFRALDNTGLSQNQKCLIYLTSYGYMCSACHKNFPKIIDIVTRLAESFLAFRKNAVRYSRPDWRSFYPEYSELFNLPEQERLEAIAKLISRKYLLLDDHKSTLTLLENQDERFRRYLIEQVDMIYYLLPAIEQGLLGTVTTYYNTVEAKTVENVTDEYTRLFDEMQEVAVARGVNLTVVLIPEASYVDEEFRQFWAPMMDFQAIFSKNHSIYESLKQRLLIKEISVIDLGDYSKELHSGYWKFDGHWNEKGNRQVAEIILSFILNMRN